MCCWQAVVLSPMWLGKIVTFFKSSVGCCKPCSFISSFFVLVQDSSNLLAAAATWEQKARADLVAALTDHRTFDAVIQVDKPTLLAPLVRVRCPANSPLHGVAWLPCRTALARCRRCWSPTSHG